MAQFVDKRYEMFESQDEVRGYFDITFSFSGKKLHAHKFMLASVSDVLKTMISDIWNKKESIEIKTNSFNDFKEFLTFIYSGSCKINDSNIFAMLDLSEFYQVKELQQKCDLFLSKKAYSKANILIFSEKLSCYTLPLFEQKLMTSIKETRYIESQSFLATPRELMKKILSFQDRPVTEEVLFEKVYQWAENLVFKKQGEQCANKFCQQCAIKAEIADLLPFIKFKKMSLGFLHKFVVKKGFLFTYAELSDILDNAFHLTINVTNESGKSISFKIPRDSSAIENIKSLKNSTFFSPQHTSKWFYWESNCKIPLTESQVKKKDGVEWYLCYYNDQNIGMMHHSIVDSSRYIIAEMPAETSRFEFTKNCKIQIE